MSASFIEVTHPCKECLVRAACSNVKGRKIDEFHNNILCLRSNTFGENSKLQHKKDLVEAWINFGHKMIYNLESSSNNKISKQMTFMKQMLDILQYLINSKSWRDNSKIQPFDEEEILKRLAVCRCKLE